jgi:hypothetical protein
MERLHGAIMDCYGLSSEQHDATAAHTSGAEAPNEKTGTWRYENLADATSGFARAWAVINGLRSLPKIVRHGGVTALRVVPRSAAVLAAVAMARDAYKEHGALMEYGEALIDLAENHWHQRLNSP